MTFKVKEWVRVTTNRDKHEPYADFVGVVVSNDDDMYRIRFDNMRSDVGGFVEQELELEDNQYIPLSIEELTILISSLNHRIEVTSDYTERQPYHDLLEKIVDIRGETFNETLFTQS